MKKDIAFAYQLLSFYVFTLSIPKCQFIRKSEREKKKKEEINENITKC